MKALSSNAVATKAKAMYGKRLRKEDYQELLRKRSVNEVAAYLKNETAYSDILDGVRENAIHRSQLEHLLKKDLYLKSQRLANFAGVGHRQFYDYLIRLAEIDQILNCIHALEGIDREGYLASISRKEVVLIFWLWLMFIVLMICFMFCVVQAMIRSLPRLGRLQARIRLILWGVNALYVKSFMKVCLM